MSNSERSKILQKIKRLMAVTVENGATEAEALTAAEKLSILQEKYGYTLSEEDLIEQEYVEDHIVSGNRREHVITFTTKAIARLTETKSLRDWAVVRGSSKRVVKFFGHPSDVEMAVYLASVVMAAIERATAEYKDTPEYSEQKKYRHGLKIINDFKYAMAVRLSNRLNKLAEQKETRQQQGVSTGTSIIVVKQQLVVDAFNQKYPNLRPGKSKPIRKSKASEAGDRAGQAVALNTPVRGRAKRAIQLSA